jgi:hypothetical protein
MKRSRILAKEGNIKLAYNPKKEQWTMTGGQWGPHYVNARCYNENVATHWKGYCINNGLKIEPYPKHYGGE